MIEDLDFSQLVVFLGSNTCFLVLMPSSTFNKICMVYEFIYNSNLHHLHFFSILSFSQHQPQQANNSLNKYSIEKIPRLKRGLKITDSNIFTCWQSWSNQRGQKDLQASTGLILQVRTLHFNGNWLWVWPAEVDISLICLVVYQMLNLEVTNTLRFFCWAWKLTASIVATLWPYT